MNAPAASLPDQPADQPTQRAFGSARALLTAGSWNLVAQFLPAGLGIALTPYVLHHLGLERYGVLALTLAITTFLGSFDGGVSAAAGRYFALFASVEDRASTGRYVLTLTAALGAFGLAVSSLLWLVAGSLLAALHVPAGLLGDSVRLLRLLGVLIALGLLRNVLASVLQARQRYGPASLTSLASSVVYGIGMVLVLQRGGGLPAIGLVLTAQAVLQVALLLPPAVRLLSVSDGCWCSRTELREFLGYCAQTQVVGLSTMVNQLADTLIVGALLGVRPVALYSAGAGFAAPLRGLALGALAPLATALAHARGTGGEQGARAEFLRLQRGWVIGITGWGAAASAAAYFGVLAWLGPQFQLSAVVATVLIVGSSLNLLTGVLTSHLQVMGRPDLDARYSLVAAGLNLALTLPCAAAFGLVGVVLATSVGSLLGSCYLLRLVRTRYDPTLRGFFADVPWRPGALAGAVVVGLELLIRPLVVTGPLGLFTCALPPVLGLVLYARLVLGAQGAAGARSALGSWRRAPDRPAGAPADTGDRR